MQEYSLVFIYSASVVGMLGSECPLPPKNDCRAIKWFSLLPNANQHDILTKINHHVEMINSTYTNSNGFQYLLITVNCLHQHP